MPRIEATSTTKTFSYVPCPHRSLGLQWRPWSLLTLAFASIALMANDSEFTAVSEAFGPATVLIGQHHSKTTNPDGTSINFWTDDREGAAANSASLSNPHMVAADAYGNTYIADKASHSILKISTDGLIHTFAGTHVPGFNGDGPAPATTLQITSPNGLFVLPSGTVFLLDPGNHRIRRVDLQGTMTTIVIDPEPRWYPSGRALWVSQDETRIYYTHEYAPIAPDTLADGAVIKMWTKTKGIEVLCSRGVGFRNPANIAVNPIDQKLYVTDRGEDDPTKKAGGVFRIDGPEHRVRLTGNVNSPSPESGNPAAESFIDQPRGIAFLSNGGYFLCAHKDGNVWYVDSEGILHLYIQGSGKGDSFSIVDGDQPPLVDGKVLAQPRAVTLAPDGALLVVSNDSGFVVRIPNIQPPVAPTSINLERDSNLIPTLRWRGIFGTGYRVERSSTLDGSVWISIGAALGTPASETSAIRDPEAQTLPNAFYRILPAF